MKERPSNWREAKWDSANIFPKRPALQSAGIWVMSARTGGLKGAFATHSWLVLKKEGEADYQRFDVVGWGRPVRRNAYAPDARWYSNPPNIDHSVNGKAAAKLIPAVENAIQSYRWSKRGDYTLWPGPNSNTFVASILQQVPQLAAETPATAVGRDFPWDGRYFGQRPDKSWFASAAGYVGITMGGPTGFELNFLGLVLGITADWRGIKLPGFGTIRF